MKVLFATGGSYIPEIFGGAECSMHELARTLGERGHTCAAVAGSRRRRDRWRRNLCWRIGGARWLADHTNGYPTVRASAGLFGPVLADQLGRARPDLLVTWNLGNVEAARLGVEAGVPVLVWVPDVAFDAYLGALPDRVTLTACSQFIVGRVAARGGRAAALLRPLVRLDAYRAAEHRPEHVTLVDARGHKGVGVTLRIAARLRHRRFLLVESLQASMGERAALRAEVRHLSNVTIVPPVPALRTVYARTSVLLVPSQVEDASPRVILEAHANGIPVVGSRTGGIPEVMGAGGLLREPRATPELWAEAVEAVFADRPRFAALARTNAARAELSPAAVTAAFLALAGAAS